MAIHFRIDCASTGSDFTHYWETVVGSGHALLALRADWQAQVKLAHEELGFRYVRFHGILCDDMGTLINQNDSLLYSFHNADVILDYLVSIGMRPFVELSFMPRALSSDGNTVFHYKANINPPRDLEQWTTLIGKLISHWLERYGADEVRQWFFEVWNEPNLDAFWSGTQDDYFEFYRHTAAAVKQVDGQLRVGGPATAANAWIDDFLTFCRDGQVPVDFVSTHHYPTDAFGNPGDDTVTQLSKSRIGVLREQIVEVRRQAGELPIYYTEWCTSSNPRDTLHDDPYAAAYIVKVVMEQQGLVQGYGYWTFSDIFEENYFPSVPFHGGFGLMNIHGIAKPSWRAFELLHDLGDEQLAVEGEHATVSVWAVRDSKGMTVVLTNLVLPRHEIATESVRLELTGSTAQAEAKLRRIDESHACARSSWQVLGEPDYPTPSQVSEMQRASRLEWCVQRMERSGDSTCIQIDMPPQSIAAIRLAHVAAS